MKSESTGKAASKALSFSLKECSARTRTGRGRSKRDSLTW